MLIFTSEPSLRSVVFPSTGNDFGFSISSLKCILGLCLLGAKLDLVQSGNKAAQVYSCFTSVTSLRPSIFLSVGCQKLKLLFVKNCPAFSFWVCKTGKYVFVFQFHVNLYVACLNHEKRVLFHTVKYIDGVM